MSDSKKNRKRTRSRLWAPLNALVRSRIRTGVIVLVPVAFTIWVLQLVFKLLDGLLQPLAQMVIPLFRDAITKPDAGAVLPLADGDVLKSARAFLEAKNDDGLRELIANLRPSELNELIADVPPEDLIAAIWRMVPQEIPGADWVIPGAGLAALFLLLYMVGFLTSATIGKRFVGLFDRFLEKVPISRTIYTASKQIVKTFGAEGKSRFRRVVLIPYPAKPLTAIAFVTNTYEDETTGREMTCVFLPTTPNPTSGFFLIVPSDEVRDLSLDVEKGVGLIMSGGILLPEHAWTLPPTSTPAQLEEGQT